MCDRIITPKGRYVCDTCENAFSEVGRVYCLKCGKPLGWDNKTYCTDCASKTHIFDECRSAFVYDDVMRRSIYRFKYNGRQEYASYYAKKMSMILKPDFARLNADAIIPVPMHKKKEHKRGYNQAYLLAKELSHLTNIPILNNYIIRNKSTKIMRNLGAKERENNLKKAFKIKGNVVKLNDVIIIDDIYTTGATLDAIAKCLKDSGVSHVYGLCLSTGRRDDLEKSKE